MSAVYITKKKQKMFWWSMYVRPKLTCVSFFLFIFCTFPPSLSSPPPTVIICAAAGCCFRWWSAQQSLHCDSAQSKGHREFRLCSSPNILSAFAFSFFFIHSHTISPSSFSYLYRDYQKLDKARPSMCKYFGWQILQLKRKQKHPKNLKRTISYK